MAREKQAVTIRDIAKECGVSAMTVSFVLNGKTAETSPQTRERVFAAIAKLNYRPNATAQRLKRSRSNTLGLAFGFQRLNYEPDGYMGIIAAAVMNAARDREMDTIVYTAHRAIDQISVPVFCDGRCDGVVLGPEPRENENIERLRNYGLPFVLINDRRDPLDIAWVDIDNMAEAERLVQYLIGLGHRRIAFAGRSMEYAANVARREGYRNAMTAAGFGRNPSLEFVSPDSSVGMDGFAAMLAAMPFETRPTAIFCYHDPAAFALIRALPRVGLRVPEDISVVGFDGLPGFDDLTSHLTTVRQPLKRMAYEAVEILASLVDGIEDVQRQRVLPGELVVRASAAPPRQRI